MRAPQSWSVAACALGVAALLTGCWERPPIDSVQQGYRGTGMAEMKNPRILAALEEANRIPEDSPAPPPGGPLAKDVFKNIKVLTDVDAATFTRLMVSITAWVAPEQGCNYCHDTNDLSSDSLYPKVVARRMLEMTRHVNNDWKNHVAATGVTCYTCHRGKPVPADVWTKQSMVSANNNAGDRYGQNAPAMTVGLTAMPVDPFQPFLVSPGLVRVVSNDALPKSGPMGPTIQHTEWSYGLMMHISQALGVNCTYCHNSRSFKEWEQPARATAWYGIRMVRDLNVNYLDPLQPTLPAERLGPQGDVPKVNCTTCHQGVNKPLAGVSMLASHPELVAAAAPAAAAAAPAPAAQQAAPLSGTIAKVLFDVGRKDLSADARAAIDGAARALKDRPETKVDLSGYADKTGNAAQNLELAKQRAFAVRDALKAAGVTDDRINLKKPEFVIGGATADARRVDINTSN